MRIVLTFIISILISCTNEAPAPDEYQVEKFRRDSIKDENEHIASTMAKNHNAVFNWDTAKTFTYEAQTELIGKTIAFKGIADDIYVDNEVYYLSLHSETNSYPSAILARVEIDKSIIQFIKRKMNDAKADGKGCFIFQVMSTEYNTTKNDLILNGILFDYYFYKSPRFILHGKV